MQSVRLIPSASNSEGNQFSPRPGWKPYEANGGSCHDNSIQTNNLRRNIIEEGVTKSKNDNSLQQSTELREVQRLKHRNTLLELELARYGYFVNYL